MSPPRGHFAWIFIASIALLSACHPPVTGNSGTATEATATIDGVSYLYLQEWNTLVQDHRLLHPLMVAYTQLPQWRLIAQRSAIAGTTFTVKANLPAGDLGITYHHRFLHPEVEIAALIMREPIDVQVAVLAHETFHSQSTRPTKLFESDTECLQEEIDATTWEAYAYATVIRPDGTDDDLTRMEDQRLALWQQGRTREVVLLTQGYQEECLGGAIP